MADPCVGYEKYKQEITAAYYQNFCNGTMAINLGLYSPPMGMKFSGFVADTPGIIYGGRWRGYGLIEAFARYHNLIPTAVEPKNSNWFLDGGGETGGLSRCLPAYDKNKRPWNAARRD